MRATGLVLLLFLIAATSNAQVVDLSYGPSEGSSWSSLLEIKVKLPIFGQKNIRMRYDLSRGQGGEVPFPVDVHVDRTTVMDDIVAGPIDATMRVDADGTVSQLQSDQLADPAQKAFVRNAVLLFPRMAGGQVAPGEQWDMPATLHIPPKLVDMGGGSVPAGIRIIIDLTYEKEVPGRGARIAVKAREAGGQRVKVDLAGEVIFDTTEGRVTSATLTGKMKVKKIFWIKVPMSIRFGDAP